ncbi:MAG: threonine/serine exporter family protein, partial [Myxococcota bacterium]
QRAHIARISALILAFVVAALAGGASIVLPVDRLALTLAALIVLLPGFSLTVALAELSTGHLSAGAARLSGVAVTFLHLSVGAAAGWALFGAGLPAEPPTPWIFEPVIIVASAASLAILFQARFQDFGVIIVSAALAVYVSRAVSLMADPTVGAFGASLLLTLYSNIQARQRDVPASIAQMPGILLLVPGSVGFRGVGALMQNETLTGVHIAFTTIITAAALVAGMLIANALYPARREL